MKILSELEIIELTGAKRYKKQIKVLRDSGINPIIGIDGKPRITWEMVNNRANESQSPPINQEQPAVQLDFSWMENIGIKAEKGKAIN